VHAAQSHNVRIKRKKKRGRHQALALPSLFPPFSLCAPSLSISLCECECIYCCYFDYPLVHAVPEGENNRSQKKKTRRDKEQSVSNKWFTLKTRKELLSGVCFLSFVFFALLPFFVLCSLSVLLASYSSLHIFLLFFFFLVSTR
jgi:VIT1/CCC1 family predicted Fe2+/Mn2+ transporter